MKDDDFIEMIISLDENNPDSLKKSLKNIASSIQSDLSSDLPDHFSILVPKLENLLQDTDSTVVTQSCQILHSLIGKFSKELESYYPSILDKIILNLADSKVTICFNGLNSSLQLKIRPKSFLSSLLNTVGTWTCFT